MTTPASGTISLGNVRAEIGVGGPIGLTDGNVRTLSGVSSGPVALSDCYNKTGAGGGGGGFVATGNSASAVGVAPGAQFTKSVSPSVTSTGGSGTGKTYLWSIATQDDANFVLTNSTSQTCTVSHIIGKYGYIGGCTLNCAVGDDAGNSANVTGVMADFDFESAI